MENKNEKRYIPMQVWLDWLVYRCNTWDIWARSYQRHEVMLS